MVPVAIALGSNLGDRAAHVAFAHRRLTALLDGARFSTLVETDPVGVGTQPRFLNGAAVGRTRLAPRALLEALLAIEAERGRDRSRPLAPRTLDLDLVLYGDRIVDEAGLILPHPRFRDRRFVLEPLAEIAADWRDPVTGHTIAALLARV
jgi:2-amino-4-hydroxy-6-hydroxymethyldihydropteridine diphosphokinase